MRNETFKKKIHSAVQCGSLFPVPILYGWHGGVRFSLIWKVMNADWKTKLRSSYRSCSSECRGHELIETSPRHMCGGRGEHSITITLTHFSFTGKNIQQSWPSSSYPGGLAWSGVCRKSLIWPISSFITILKLGRLYCGTVADVQNFKRLVNVNIALLGVFSPAERIRKLPSILLRHYYSALVQQSDSLIWWNYDTLV